MSGEDRKRIEGKLWPKVSTVDPDPREEGAEEKLEEEGIDQGVRGTVLPPLPQRGPGEWLRDELRSAVDHRHERRSSEFDLGGF